MTGDNSRVLLIVDDEEGQLEQTLTSFGYKLVVRYEMHAAIDTLQHGNFSAVFVDDDHMSEDTLEFVLNVRDVDDEVPILVVGGLDDYKRKVLSDRSGVYLVSDSKKELAAKTSELLQ
jgi:DNA-binding NtrC family response regulator